MVSVKLPHTKILTGRQWYIAFLIGRYKGFIQIREVNKKNFLGGQFLLFLPPNPGN